MVGHSGLYSNPAQQPQASPAEVPAVQTKVGPAESSLQCKFPSSPQDRSLHSSYVGVVESGPSEGTFVGMLLGRTLCSAFGLVVGVSLRNSAAGMPVGP